MDGFFALGLALAITHAHLEPVAQHDKPKWYITTSAGRAVADFLGSEDPRRHNSFGIAYARREPKLRFRNLKAELVTEAYYERSMSPGASQQPPNRTDAWGLMTYARYRKGLLFFDIGWGTQYVDQRTVDLSGRLNSSPNFTIGVSLDSAERELLVGLRLMHISNAGLQGNNQGVNQVSIFAALRF